jgi:hypothetical protein
MLFLCAANACTPAASSNTEASPSTPTTTSSPTAVATAAPETDSSASPPPHVDAAFVVSVTNDGILLDGKPVEALESFADKPHKVDGLWTPLRERRKARAPDNAFEKVLVKIPPDTRFVVWVSVVTTVGWSGYDVVLPSGTEFYAYVPTPPGQGVIPSRVSLGVFSDAVFVRALREIGPGEAPAPLKESVVQKRDAQEREKLTALVREACRDRSAVGTSRVHVQVGPEVAFAAIEFALEAVHAARMDCRRPGKDEDPTPLRAFVESKPLLVSSSAEFRQKALR